MPKAPVVPTASMSNQKKLDFLVDLLANGGPSALYGASVQALIDDIPRRVVKSKVIRDGKEIDLDQEIADSKSILLRMEARQEGLVAAVAALSAGVGADPKVIIAAIDEAVDRNLAHLTATVTIQAASDIDASKE